MTIEFNCPHCQKLLRTSDEKAGLTARCPSCQESVLVPAQVASEPVHDASEWETPVSAETAAGYSSPPPLQSATKPCPMCGESIKAAAIRCRFCGEDLHGSPPSMGTDTAGMPYAGFWLRFVAFFIDFLIVGAVNFVVGLVIGLVFGGMAAAGGGGGNPMGNAEAMMIVIQVIANVVGIIINWLYFALMESSERQATLGKMAMGLIVTDGQGRRISFGRATGRFFGKIVSILTCLIGYIMAGFTERKQALHDLIADCLVVRQG